MKRGGRFGIGSDSHISVSPQEELRLLEYGQRLSLRRRAVLASERLPSVGRSLYQTAARGGAQALGIDGGEIRRGAPADFVVMDAEHPALYGKSRDALLDAAIFASGRNPVKSVWVGGEQIVRDGQHPAREAVFSRFKAVMKSLSEGL